MAVSLKSKKSGKGGQAAASALRTLSTEQAGLAALHSAFANGLAVPFAEAVDLIRSAKGRVVVSGMGKSGHIGRKIAATLASTGTPAFFVHPAEASHGDLGMVTPDDVVIALSWSGETAELRSLLEYSQRWEIRLIAVTAWPESTLALQSDIVLLLPRAAEACATTGAPTTSTLMQLALGDALAVALLEARGFDRESYHALHPGGRLGANLHYVRDVMHRDAAVPLTRRGAPMSEAIMTMSGKRLGCVGIVDPGGALIGVITDGDLRRHLSGPDILARRVDDVMTKAPKTISPDTLVGEALSMMNLHQHPFTVLFVVENGKPVGIVHMHDLLRLGVA